MQLPDEFTSRMKDMLGESEYDQFDKAITSTSPTSIRVNPLKPSMDIPHGQIVPWCKTGRYLEQRPSFTFDPLFHAGSYYVQEASSMFVNHIISTLISEPSTDLDLCAAPGGKSTLAISALPQGSVLIANEIVRQRANILAENITKWGNPNTIVTNNCASDFQPLGPIFDLIICDAPCSGEGMFRKDPQSIDEWSTANVAMCQERQREILSDIWQCLKPGGLLIYSTCTYNTLENEENAVWAAEQLGAELISIDIPSEWNISNNKLSNSNFNVYRFFPHKTQGEGFFACIMRKNSDAEIPPTRTSTNKEHKKGPDNPKGKELPMPKDIKQWLSHPEQYTFKSSPTSHTAFPTQHFHLLEQALAHLKVIHYGITIANIKGKAIIPAHSLAMSASLNAEMFPSTELTEQQAIAYLRTEPITLSPSTPTGYVLLKYKGLPLGFAKNIGNRANNLYPSEWRIRKSI